MPLLAISMACLFNEQVFKRLMINKCFSGYFVKTDVNSWCNFSHSYSSFAATLNFIKVLCIPSKFVMRLNTSYAFLGWNAFCLHKLRLTTAFDKLISCTLWIVHAYGSVKGNCVGVVVTELLLSFSKWMLSGFVQLVLTCYFFPKYYEMVLWYLLLNHQI